MDEILDSYADRATRVAKESKPLHRVLPFKRKATPVGDRPDVYLARYVNTDLFRQNTYLQNKKHTLTCQVGLVVTDLITSPVVSWEGWETPPPSTEAQLSFFAQPPVW